MTVYEKNIKTLAHYYSRMDELIEQAKRDCNEELEIFEEKAYDNSTILKVKKDHKIRYLSGKRGVAEPAGVWIQTLGKLQMNAPVLMFGTGNPTYLKELVETTDTRITIFIYEPSLQIFLKFLEQADLEKWMKKHSMIFWIPALQKMDEVYLKFSLERLLTYEMLNYSKTIILPNYDVLFPEQAVQFVRICRDIAAKETVQYNTRNAFSGVTAENLLRNARYLCDGYKTTQLTEVIPRDIPGIVVAAGPSLNKNIMELKNAKGKAFIIAVDTAIRPLLNAGIIPDMFATIDGLKPPELVRTEEAKRIPLMATLNASPEIMDYHTGMKFFWNEGYQFADKIFEKSGQPVGDVSCGGSVATNAFSLLYKIGIKTVILVGQDLAYTGNRSHADGTFQEVMEEQDTSKFLLIEGNYEEWLPTESNLKMYRDWYNNYIEGCIGQHEDFRVINATEGGAKINHTEIMTLKEAIEQECTKEVDIQACLQRLQPMLDKEKRKNVVEYLYHLIQEFQELQNSARQMLKLYKKLNQICNRRNIDAKEYLNILEKLKKHISPIERLDVYQLIRITMNKAQYIIWNEQFRQEDTWQKEGKEIARKGIIYMENVEEMAGLFKEVAQEVYTQENLEKSNSDK